MTISASSILHVPRPSAGNGRGRRRANIVIPLGCAFVEGDTVYAYGVDKWGGSKITLFRSKDMEKWEERLALHLPGWELFNTSVCKADDRFVMAIEVGAPSVVVGIPFTIFFLESKDLLEWKLLPQES